MARRRKLRSALSGGFYGLQGFMQYLMLLEREKRQQQMTLERQRESDVAGLSSNLIMESLRDPQFAQRASRMGKLGELDLSTLAPPQAALGKPLLDLLAAAKSRADLPGPRQAVEIMRSSGMNVDPTLEKVSSPSEADSIPSVQFQPGSPAPVSNLLTATRERAGGIEAAELAAAKLEEDKARYAALGKGRGEEIVTSETHPALLARKEAEGALETDVLKRREDVLRPGRAATEGAKARAAKQAEYSTLFANSARLLQHETDKAKAALVTIPDEERLRVGARRIEEVRQTSGRLMVSVIKLLGAYDEAQPDLAQMGALGGEVVASLRAKGPRAQPFMTPAARRYFDAVDAALPYLAKLSGEVGNLAEQEQERAGLTVATILDAQGDGETGREKFLRLLAFSSQAPMLAGQFGDKLALSPEAVLYIKNAVDQRVEELRAQFPRSAVVDKELLKRWRQR